MLLVSRRSSNGWSVPPGCIAFLRIGAIFRSFRRKSAAACVPAMLSPSTRTTWPTLDRSRNFLRCALSALGKAAHLAGNNGETESMFSGPCGLDSSIQGHQDGLFADLLEYPRSRWSESNEAEFCSVSPCIDAQLTNIREMGIVDGLSSLPLPLTTVEPFMRTLFACDP